MLTPFFQVFPNTMIEPQWTLCLRTTNWEELWNRSWKFLDNDLKEIWGIFVFGKIGSCNQQWNFSWSLQCSCTYLHSFIIFFSLDYSLFIWFQTIILLFFHPVLSFLLFVPSFFFLFILTLIFFFKELLISCPVTVSLQHLDTCVYIWFHWRDHRKERMLNLNYTSLWGNRHTHSIAVQEICTSVRAETTTNLANSE